MVKRYDFSEYANIGPIADGDWVEYEDYEKLFNLCGRMAILIEDSAGELEAYGATIARELLREWEEMK